jgi:hypothetical protein
MKENNIVNFLDSVPKHKKWEIENRSIDDSLTKLEKELDRKKLRGERLIKYSYLLLKKIEAYNLIYKKYK